MAENVQISVKDNESALEWLANITLLNEQYRDAMEEAGQTLEDMQNFADGTMVDEFVDLGSKVISAAKATFEAIDAIGTTVRTVLEKVGGFVESAKNVIGNVAKLIGF